MAGNSKPITTDKLYDRMDDMRKELTQTITTAVSTVAQSQGRLEKKFDDLEAGRLTRAEGNINELRLELQKVINAFNTKAMSEKEAVSNLTGKFVIVYGLIGAVFVAVVTALAYRLIVGGTTK